MTMHQPSPRIITFKRYNQAPTIRQQGHISPHGVNKIQTWDQSLGELSGELTEDVEIVTVEMDRVGNTTSVLNGEEMEFIFLAEHDDVLANSVVGFSDELVDLTVEDVFDGWAIPFDIQLRSVAVFSDNLEVIAVLNLTR
jgi:hypothetical protein